MSIESITKRIQDEAQAFADEKAKEAEKQKKAILAEAEEAVARIKADSEVKAKEDSELLVSRRESVADLETRKMQLAAKQELIEESFNEALNKLLSLDEADYIKFMTNQLKGFDEGEGEILLNAADKKKYKEALEKELKGTSLKISDEDADIKGGFILRKGNISYNSSIEKLLESQKEAMTSEIAKKLFPSE
jgi:V/A-type H+-transporting ATPase subunit E